MNRKKIAELEALAKTIYDYWFVQFDFPDKNGKPYKSSGGKMVWNAQLKREIPEGWEDKSISECGEFRRGVSYSKSDEVDNSEHSISVYRGNNISNGYVVKDSNTVYIKKTLVHESQILKPEDILIAMSSGSKDHVGKAGLVTTRLPLRTFGAFCTCFKPKRLYKNVIFNFFSSQAYKTYIKQICSGTGINNLKAEHYAKKLFSIPSDKTLMQFNEIQDPIYQLILSISDEIEQLKDQRDFLLPLLMNGQAFIKN